MHIAHVALGGGALLASIKRGLAENVTIPKHKKLARDAPRFARTTMKVIRNPEARDEKRSMSDSPRNTPLYIERLCGQHQPYSPGSIRPHG